MKRNPAILTLALAVPILLFLLQHYFYHSPDLHPTGFTVDENVLYMSYAHQYLDQPGHPVFYSNPFDGNPGSPAIYIQPVNFLFAAAMKAGADPGCTLSVFGFISALLCIYMGIRLLKHLLQKEKNQGWIVLLFTWGGGLTAAAGIAAWLFLPEQAGRSGFDAIFNADPANGWWGLSWGRNLFIPLEAWYHFLFLLNIFLILKQRWMTGLFTAFLLAISHPFTGTEFLLIITGWLLIEKIVFKNKTIPVAYLAGILLISICHFGYYLVYLNQFPEHRLLFSQYSASWTYSLRIAIPAYMLVVILSLFAVHVNKLSPLLSSPQQRLFLCWALIAFLLSKHEWFIKPMQPVHFSRGYPWAGCFLFALPVLNWLFNKWQHRFKTILLAIFVLLLLNDNLLWTVNLLRKKDNTEWEGHLTRSTREVLDYLHRYSSANDLVTGNAALVNYMCNVYSPANAWVSHPYNTPDISERRQLMAVFLQSGEKPSAWNGRRILIVEDRLQQTEYTLAPVLQKNKVFENDRYRIFIP